MMEQMDVVVLEEHYGDRALDRVLGREKSSPIADLLYADPAQRLARIDRLGIETEVLALAPPGLQGVTSHDAAVLAQEVNDRLAEFMSHASRRFGAFAALPTIAPEAAAEELTRCVKTLGFLGAMLHGPTGGIFLDDPRFAPIFAAAETLDVPLYLHPSEILPDVRQSYFAPYDQTHPMFIRAGWGYTIETGTHAMRLIMSGIFERHPGLRIILGHFGEGIPFLLDRIDEALARDTPMKNFRDVFRKHFHVTSSGFFSDAALRCCLEQLDPDRIMFSLDAPYVQDQSGMDWLAGLDLAPELKRDFSAGNARKLLGLS